MGGLFDLGLHVGGDEFGRAVLGKLQGAQVGDDGPAFLGGQLVAVAHHGVLAVGDDVEDLAVRVGADERRLEVGDRHDGDVAFEGGAHLHDAVAVGRVAVADRAIDLVLGLAEGEEIGRAHV